MYKLRRIDISSVALYSFLMILIISIIIMIPFGLFFSMISSFTPDNDLGSPGLPGIFSGFFLILFPLLYAILGTIINVLIALIYNGLSSKFGGLKIELNQVED